MTPEQEARNMLERMGVEDAQNMTAGDVVEIANIIRDRDKYKDNLFRIFTYMIHNNEFKGDLISGDITEDKLNEWGIKSVIHRDSIYFDLI
jgi:hypothetical protein